MFLQRTRATAQRLLLARSVRLSSVAAATNIAAPVGTVAVTRQPSDNSKIAPLWRESLPKSSSLFTNDYVQAWSLLEVCLENGNLQRAEAALLGFAELSRNAQDVTLAVNHFLLRYVDANAGAPWQAQAWCRKISYLLGPKFRKNTVTDAILLKNVYLGNDKASFESFVTANFAQLPELLAHVEILGVTTSKAIAKRTGVVLDARLQTLLDDAKEVAPQPQNEDVAQPKDDFTQTAPQIEKSDVEELTPISSVSLKGIRHVLLGLKLAPKDLPVEQLPYIQDKKLNDTSYVDFFELSKQLDTEGKEQLEKLLDEINERRQYNIEMRGVEAARMKWRQMFEGMADRDRKQTSDSSAPHLMSQSKRLETMLWHWNEAMMPLVQEEFDKCNELLAYDSKHKVPAHVQSKMGKSFGDRFEYAPYLALAKPENLPAMTLMELLRPSSQKRVEDGIRSVVAVLSVGKNVELDFRYRALRAKEKEALTDVKANKKTLAKLRRKVRQQALDTMVISWPKPIRAKIGSMLLSLLLQVAKVQVHGTDPVTGKSVKGVVPAFYHSYRYESGNRVGILKAHKNVAKYLSGESIAAAIQPQLLPMLVKPRPWTAWNQGGYLCSQSNVIRSKDAPEQIAYVRAASDAGKLSKVFTGLNVLGNTAWTINKDLFKVISKIWNTKEEFLDIPAYAEPQLASDKLPPVPPRDADPAVRRDYFRNVRRMTLENTAVYSQRCDLNYKLDIARAFLGERFYMPHNLDFRGRAYPLSPHLNHLGNDVSRSLLIFWEGRKLGKTGLNWLKVHLANLFGHSKMTLDERISFVDNNIEHVRESVASPMGSQRWWTKADAPFQALATCMDLVRALDSPNPEEYVSHLSVHQDGSCNGLQHYAALGGDVEGAIEVNLANSARPQDVYTRVLRIVEASVAQDAKEGSATAKALLPVLSRKVVKQTVMTHVYGVTYVGAREQIANRLREIEGYTDSQVFVHAGYLANKVLSAVRELFHSAHLIQDWLGDISFRICHSVTLGEDKPKNAVHTPSFMSSVIWTTPLGLPIVQPYRKEKMKQITTELQSVFIKDPYSFQSVNYRKQKMAFPPNFIHSLDATHMLLSAIECEKRGISFAAVHDSYWTHAGDTDTMSRILRECFVQLHSVDLIARLKEECEQRYGHLFRLAEINLNTEVGHKVDQALISYAREKHGYNRSLELVELLELEQQRRDAIAKGETPRETPASILDSTSEEVLQELENDVRLQKKTAAPAAPLRSTEHVGTGLDKQEAEEETREVKRSRRRNKATVLVPIRIPPVPTRGGFDVRNVLESPYFFS